MHGVVGNIRRINREESFCQKSVEYRKVDSVCKNSPLGWLGNMTAESRSNPVIAKSLAADVGGEEYCSTNDKDQPLSPRSLKRFSEELSLDHDSNFVCARQVQPCL